MDNAEQNRIIMEAVEKVLAAREEAAAAMSEVLISHMEVRFTHGRKKVIKSGTLYGFNAEENVMIVKVGRSVDEVPIERLLEIVEPRAFEVTEESDEEPENAVYLDTFSHEPPAPDAYDLLSDDVVGPDGLTPRLRALNNPQMEAKFQRWKSGELKGDELEEFARQVSGYTGPAKPQKGGNKKSRKSLGEEPPF